ncbi:helix-turn-helix domain-containing protein [Pleomorphovibrio marinus]|uniref:helix-turn-helix domain-containing protein n=1 Tax=Pleomorphovibrio marinus TaxID=2164132 RepID=UPI000E0AB9D3|nr:helix-turn-helix transcriptional regulator [Pleomorphovibrio marinus]
MNSLKSGESGIWWHEDNKGPLEKIPFFKQFGSMKFSKVRMDENMRPHLNDGIEIHFIESGKYDWVIEDKSVEMLPDDLSVTAPWHWNGSPAGKMDMGQINWIILKPEKFSQSEPLDLGLWTSLTYTFQMRLGEMIAHEKGIVIRKAKAFQKYFDGIRHELLAQRPCYDIIVVNLLENLLIELHRHLSSRQLKMNEDGSFIKTLEEMVFEDLTEKWPVETLAEKFGMGKTKFTEKVKRLTGYPPNSYIINLKIEKAKDLLREDPSCNLSEVAYHCGFSSLQHFTTTFSQRTGATPGRFQHGNI